jgi:hypothetical protein
VSTAQPSGDLHSQNGNCSKINSKSLAYFSRPERTPLTDHHPPAFHHKLATQKPSPARCFLQNPLQKQQSDRRKKSGLQKLSSVPSRRRGGNRSDANFSTAKTAALSHDVEDASRTTVSTVPRHPAGSLSPWRAVVCEASLRMHGALCRQSDSTHSQFHSNHRSTGRCTSHQLESETAETIDLSNCP